MWKVRQTLEFTNQLLGEVVVLIEVDAKGRQVVEIVDYIVGLVTKVDQHYLEVTCKQDDKIDVYVIDSSDVWHPANVEQDNEGHYMRVFPIWELDIKKMALEAIGVLQ